MARRIGERYCRTLDELIEEKKDGGLASETEVQIHGQCHRFGIRYLREIASLDVVGPLRRIECPILILHGDEDEIVNIEEGKAAEMVGRNTTFYPAHGAGHSFCGNHLDSAIGIISSWVREGKVPRGRRWWANLCLERKHSLLSFTVKKGLLCLLILVSLGIICCPILMPGKFCLTYLPLAEGKEQMSGQGQMEATGWWAILALISGLTIGYVGFINRLREQFPKLRMERWDFRRERKEREVSWNMVLLSWAICFMFITICAITFRIFCIYGNVDVSPSLVYSVILYSFAASTVFRIWLFLDSHRKYLTIYLFAHHRSKR